jgi:hypothetical protein
MRHLSFIFALTQPLVPKPYFLSEANLQRIRSFQLTPHTPLYALGDGYQKTQRPDFVQPAKYQPLAHWVQAYFACDITAPGYRLGEGQHGAIFSVSRELLMQYPLALYQRLKVANSGSDVMEAGYYMERLWRMMFVPQSCVQAVQSKESA